MLLERSVEEAAVMVAELPSAKVEPLMVVTPALVRRELPIEVVAMTEPLALVESMEFVRDVMAKEVEVPNPMFEELAVRFVVDAVEK